jgi:CDP-diacylglycerol--serine O-phosphatidyltransferase
VYTFQSPETVWIIAALFPACAALRLARFNVETGDDDDHLHFKGLPSPAAAGSIAGFAILFFTLRQPDNTHEWIDSALQHILPWFAVAVGALMVSRIPYPHIVNQMFRGYRSFAHVVGLLFAIVAIMVFRGYAVPLLCAGFVLGPPIWHFMEVMRSRREQKEPLF